MASNPDRIRLLHVDDEPDFAEMAAEFITREADHITVETANSSDEGLDHLRSADFDCIVSDYDMPSANGVEFLRKVREDYPELPFILFTGKGSEEVASEAISAGVTDYLQKSSGSDQYKLLVNRVENAVEQTRAKAQIEETESWAETMLTHASDYCMVVDESAEITYVSPAVERILGWNPDTLIGNDAFEFTHPDDVQSAIEKFTQVLDLDQDEAVTVEFRAADSDGDYHWVSVRGRNLLDDPIVQGVLVNVRDISDRKEREKNLRRKERAMDAAPIGITITDPSREDNPIIYVNHGFQRITGYREEEIIGRNCRFLQGPDTAEKPVEEMGQAVEAAEPVTVELLNYRKDGSEFWNEVTIAPIETEKGEVSHFVGFQQDVSERMEGRRRLEQAQVRTEHALDATDSYIFEIDFDTGEETRFGDWESLHGIDPSEVPTTEAFVERAVHPEDQDEVRTVYTEFDPQPGKSVKFDFRTHPELGPVKWIRAKLRVQSKPEGDGFRGIGLSTDVTDLITGQQELRRRNQQLEEFAGVISHDLKSPLQVASGNLELVSENYDDKALSNAVGAIERMQTLTDELLELAKAGRTIGDVESVNLDSISKQIWQSMDTGSADLVCETDTAIEADRNRFSRLLENVFRNAFEHGGEDVTVTIGRSENGFFIEDNGDGIAEAEREKVMERGYSESTEGSGFGMSIIKGIAEAHGWSLELAEGRSGGLRIELRDVEISN